jgi:Protein of unknown function (DUF3108)
LLPPSRPGYHYPNGLTLTLDVEWRLFNAGTATLKVEPAGDNQRFIANADSIGAIAMLYHVHDRFESTINPHSNCSLLLTKHVEEGFRRLDTNIRFDYSARKSVLDEKNFKANQSKHQDNDIPTCVSDVLSSIFYVGSLPLAPNGYYGFPINDGGKTSVVTVHVEGKEEVKTPAGTFKTIRVQPESDTGSLKSKGKIWLWYTDDDRRIPVQMRARMFWGTLTLKASKIQQ